MFVVNIWRCRKYSKYWIYIFYISRPEILHGRGTHSSLLIKHERKLIYVIVKQQVDVEIRRYVEKLQERQMNLIQARCKAVRILSGTNIQNTEKTKLTYKQTRWDKIKVNWILKIRKVWHNWRQLVQKEHDNVSKTGGWSRILTASDALTRLTRDKNNSSKFMTRRKWTRFLG